MPLREFNERAKTEGRVPDPGAKKERDIVREMIAVQTKLSQKGQDIEKIEKLSMGRQRGFATNDSDAFKYFELLREIYPSEGIARVTIDGNFSANEAFRDIFHQLTGEDLQPEDFSAEMRKKDKKWSLAITIDPDLDAEKLAEPQNKRLARDIERFSAIIGSLYGGVNAMTDLRACVLTKNPYQGLILGDLTTQQLWVEESKPK